VNNLPCADILRVYRALFRGRRLLVSRTTYRCFSSSLRRSSTSSLCHQRTADHYILYPASPARRQGGAWAVSKAAAGAAPRLHLTPHASSVSFSSLLLPISLPAFCHCSPLSCLLAWEEGQAWGRQGAAAAF